MIGKYKVITLCGSTRFKDEFIETQKRLTLEGNIVISVWHSGDNEVWENMDEGTLTQTKEMLDDNNDAANAFWEHQGYSLRTNLNYRNKSLHDEIPAGE